MKSISSVPLSLMLIGLSLSAQSASAAPRCGEFMAYVTPGDVHIQRADEGDFGLGDSRMGGFELTDPSGAPLGEVHFRAVAVSQKDGRFRMLGDGHYTYENGTLHYPMSYELPDPNAQPVASGTGTLVHYVSGGTGDFGGATGTIEASFTNSGTRVHKLSLSCAD